MVTCVKDDEDLKTFLNDKYTEAVQHLFKLDFMKNATDKISIYNAILVFCSGLLALVITYIVIPMCSMFGMSLGKRMMGLYVVNDDGFLLKRWRILLRAIPMLALLFIYAFVSTTKYQLIAFLVIFLVSLAMMLFTPNKQALHDYIARTIVVSKEGANVFMDTEAFERDLKEKEALAAQTEDFQLPTEDFSYLAKKNTATDEIVDKKVNNAPIEEEKSIVENDNSKE